MAVTKIWPIHGRVDHPLDYVANEEKTENPRWDKSSLQNLTDVMHYAADDDKTQKQFFVTGINCNADTARDQFVTVKKQFGKEDGIVAYHGYQSFAGDEVSPEEAHAIGVEFARHVWGDAYQVVVATHLNTGNVHNHYVVNSISFRDGKRCRAKQWTQLNRISDEICRAHGLAIIEHPAGRSVPGYLYRAEQAGQPTRLNIAKAAVDEALRVSVNLREFRMIMDSMGYVCDLDPNHKYWTVRQKDWKRPIRMARMGPDYTNARIRERLLEDREEKSFALFQRALRPVRQYRFATRRDKIRKRGGLTGLYLHYCYLLGYLPAYRKRPHRVSPALRDDLIRMDRIAEETRLLCREHIETMEQLHAFRDARSEQIETLTARRKELKKQSRRKIPPEEKESLQARARSVTEEITALRKELKLIEGIEARTPDVEDKVRQALEQEAQRCEAKENDRER